MIRFTHLVLAMLTILAPALVHAQSSPDQGKDIHLVYIGETGSTQYKWFFTNSDLVSLREQCNWSHLLPTDSIFKEKYAPVVGTDMPIVLFMRNDGGLIHSASGANFPRQASVLFADLRSSFRLAQKAKPAEQVTEQFGESIEPPCIGPNCPPKGPDAVPVVNVPNMDVGRIRIRERVFDQMDSMTDRATYHIAGAILIGFLLLLVGLGFFLILLRR